jgi:hypothetical protein
VTQIGYQKGSLVINQGGATEADLKELEKKFAEMLELARKLPEGEAREDAENAVSKLKAEVDKGEQAEKSEVRARINFLKGMAPDIFDVAVTTLANPALGVTEAIRMIAAKQDAEGKGRSQGKPGRSTVYTATELSDHFFQQRAAAAASIGHSTRPRRPDDLRASASGDTAAGLPAGARPCPAARNTPAAPR